MSRRTRLIAAALLIAVVALFLASLGGRSNPPYQVRAVHVGVTNAFFVATNTTDVTVRVVCFAGMSTSVDHYVEDALISPGESQQFEVPIHDGDISKVYFSGSADLHTLGILVSDFLHWIGLEKNLRSVFSLSVSTNCSDWMAPKSDRRGN